MARLDLKTKALMVIEALTFDDIKLSKEQETALIYKFSHVALSGHCNSCKHDDWEQELHTWYKKLVEVGFMPGLEKGTEPSDDLLEVFTLEQLKERGIYPTGK